MSEERGEYRHGNQLAQQGNQNAVKPESEKRSATVQVRTTQAHKAEMQEKAAAAGISLNEWILKQIQRNQKR